MLKISRFFAYTILQIFVAFLPYFFKGIGFCLLQWSERKTGHSFFKISA